MIFFSLNFFLLFPMKTYFWEQEYRCSQGLGILSLHNQSQQFVVSWERSATRFSYALQSRLIIFSPNLFFFVFIIWYSALLIHVPPIKVILLLLFCYLIKDFAFFSFLFLLFYFNFLTVLERNFTFFLHSLVFSAVAK